MWSNQRWRHYRVALDSDDDRTHLLVEGHVCPEWPKGSIFGSLQEASDFFQRGSLGYSVTKKPGEFDGLELWSFTWQVQALAVEKAGSSFFETSIWVGPASRAFRIMPPTEALKDRVVNPKSALRL